MGDSARRSTAVGAGAVSDGQVVELTDGWTIASSEPGAWAGPSEWVGQGGDAVVPGTVAASMGRLGLDEHPDYDAEDWWYRTNFEVPETDGRIRLRFEGLATLAEVWLNGTKVLDADNMFRSWSVDVTERVRERNELVIAFRSVGEALRARRPRPRWKTRLVENQALRWIRTTLLGRIPGWTPAVAPVGPWRPVRLEVVGAVDVRSMRLQPRVDDGAAHLTAEAVLRLAEGVSVSEASIEVAGHALPCEVAHDSESDAVVRCDVAVEGAPLWWPNTHGEPVLHDAVLAVGTSLGPIRIDCGRIGFRSIEVDREAGAIGFRVNGVPVFCRGSCWSSNDVVTLTGDEASLEASLELLARASGNMIRVGGTMVYESDRFYDLCDELGIMVWQDFMFANMHYPADDADFVANVEAEARDQVERLHVHPSVVAYCGSSEIEQQAAMFGAAPGLWSNELFGEVLPGVVSELHPGTPYWTSTPTGGALPFHVGDGLAHYFGVGAYRRPLEDVRLADVRFSPECLGFANVPSDAALADLTPSGSVPPHDPAWKRGVPRDSGAGWDFDDVRDHYLGLLYGVDPVWLRADDPRRYLATSREVSGVVMAHVFGEWRSGGRCGGGLTWFFRDLRPGAGWGLIDSSARPKAVYHHLRRVWAPRAVRILDRGLDGVRVVLFNDEGSDWRGDLELLLVRGATITARGSAPLTVSARDSVAVGGDELLGYFTDSTYAYRFGPQQHDAIVARFTGEAGLVVEHVHVPDRSRTMEVARVEAAVEARDGGLAVRLRTDALAYDVRVRVRDHEPEDDHFDLTPGLDRVVALHAVGTSDRAFRGHVEGSNLVEDVRLTLPE